MNQKVSIKKKCDMSLGKKSDMIMASCVSWVDGDKVYKSSWEMNTATRVEILDETDCISHSTSTLGKGMNPIILLPAMGK